MLKDNTKFGILIGLIGPFFAMLGFYFWRFSTYTFNQFATHIYQERKALITMLTFSLIANAITFTLFINKDKDYTAKGIFIITMVWAAVIIALKIFG